MRILQVMGTLDRGGVESMIVNLVRNGFKTDICLEIPDKGAMEEELKKYWCQIYHLTRRSTSMAKHHRELAEIARNYDIVHIHAQNWSGSHMAEGSKQSCSPVFGIMTVDNHFPDTGFFHC